MSSSSYYIEPVSVRLSPPLGEDQLGLTLLLDGFVERFKGYLDIGLASIRFK